MDEIFNFLKELKANNNREWFQDNLTRYRDVQKQFDELMSELLKGVSSFDTSIAGLQVKDCTYRIYRDVRFSPNKEPYKTHIGGYMCPKGKKSGFAGYYFHLEPENSILAVGLHCPEPKIVASVRDEIFDNGKEFLNSIEVAKGFSVDRSSSLKRVPRGYPQDSEYGEYLKLKEFDLVKPLEIDDKTVERTIGDFKSTYPFVALLNRAVAYAKEN